MILLPQGPWSRQVHAEWGGGSQGWWRGRGHYLTGFKFQVCRMKPLEVDGGDSCTTMWMHLMPQKCVRLAVVRMAQEGSRRGGTEAAL